MAAFARLTLAGRGQLLARPVAGRGLFSASTAHGLLLARPATRRGLFTASTAHAPRHWTDGARATWLGIWRPPVWVRRSVRALRVAALSVAIFEIGKARGHTEALEDPEGMQLGLVRRRLSLAGSIDADAYPPDTHAFLR